MIKVFKFGHWETLIISISHVFSKSLRLIVIIYIQNPSDLNLVGAKPDP